jgi:hypothetical protein
LVGDGGCRGERGEDAGENENNTPAPHEPDLVAEAFDRRCHHFPPGTFSMSLLAQNGIEQMREPDTGFL